MKGVLVFAVVCLAAGVGVIFGYCNGTTGLQFGYPLSASSIHIDITTTGAGVPIAVGLVAIGAFLLIVATIIALDGNVSTERRIRTEQTPRIRLRRIEDPAGSVILRPRDSGVTFIPPACLASPEPVSPVSDTCPTIPASVHTDP